MTQLRRAYMTTIDRDARPCDREAKAWAWITAISTAAMAVGIVLGVVFSV